jgi:hypothetical protein
MINPETCYVEFDGHEVAVSSDVPEVSAALKKSFSWMLRPKAAGSPDRLEVGRTSDGYLFQSDWSRMTSTLLDEVLGHLDQEVVLRLMLARPELVWLHAGAAARNGLAVLVCGPSGRGKSTVITALCNLGWQFLSDDITPFDPASQKAIPFPLTPMYRPYPGAHVPPDCLHQLPKVKAPVDVRALCRDAVPVGGLIFPNYDARQLNELTTCPPSSAALSLLQNWLNFVVHRETAFDWLAQLTRTLPAFQLSFASGPQAAQLIAQKF